MGIMSESVQNTGGDKNGGVDWMCVCRYTLYGALVGGVVAKMIFGDNAVVYLGAGIGAVAFSLAKLKFLS